jgi:hypothetical protein
LGAKKQPNERLFRSFIMDSKTSYKHVNQGHGNHARRILLVALRFPLLCTFSGYEALGKIDG